MWEEADNSVVSSSFNHPRQAQTKNRHQVGFLGSFRLRGALAVGMMAAVAVLGTTKWLEHRENSAASIELAKQLVQHADVLQAQLDTNRQSSVELQSAIEYALANLPQLGAQVFDLSGEVVASNGVSNLLSELSLKYPHPLPAGGVVGEIGGLSVVEVNRQLLGELGQSGTLRLRIAIPTITWSAGVNKLAMIAAAISFLLAWLVLGRAFRALGDIHFSLARAAKSDLCHRVPIGGCGEIRGIANELNDTLDGLDDGTVKIQKVYVDTVLALSRTVEAKDRYTSGHSQRVAKYCVEMGEWLGFDYERLEILRLGALLHDIGKVAVPDSVLCKPGPLDDDEFEEMRRHPMAGDRILGAIPGLRDIADIARSHHERWDGKGYPLGVAGESIPLEGRICAIADAYDAMVTKRSYKPAMPLEKALGIIQKDAGSHFDPELAKLFVSMKRNGKGYKSLTAATEMGDNRCPDVHHPPPQVS